MGTFIMRAAVGADVNVAAGANSAGLVGGANYAEALALPSDSKTIVCSGAAPRSFEVQVTPSMYLDGGGTALGAVIDVPTGFVVTAAQVNFAASWNGGSESYVNDNSTGTLVRDGQAIGPTIERSGVDTLPTTVTLTLPVSTVSLFGLFGWTCSYTSTMNLTVEQLTISGTYIIAAWWYSESLDDWQHGEDPGGDYVEEPDGHPYPYVSSITPNSGPTAGGTSVTIVGGGFLGPDGLPGVLNVMFDGEYPATSVVVSDQHELTCVTPAHWYGTYNVVVNLDF